jgi:hypothetical protein
MWKAHLAVIRVHSIAANDPVFGGSAVPERPAHLHQHLIHGQGCKHVQPILLALATSRQNFQSSSCNTVDSSQRLISLSLSLSLERERQRHREIPVARFERGCHTCIVRAWMPTSPMGPHWRDTAGRPAARLIRHSVSKAELANA